MKGNTRITLCIIFHVLVSLSFVEIVKSSKDIMRDIHNAFGKFLKDCSMEEGLSHTAMEDFYNYWKEDYALLNRDFGCAILCVTKKLDLITGEYRVHHGNTKEFVQAFGGDESMVKQLIEIIHSCEEEHASVTDDCSRVLEISKCFRTKTHRLGWAPTIDQVIGEIITEI